jgi:hypothetical protein
MGDNDKRKRLVYRERDGEVTVVEKSKKGFFSKFSPRNLFKSCKGDKKTEFSMPKVERSKSKIFDVRGVVIKFPEYFYCKPHTCILTAH